MRRVSWARVLSLVWLGLLCGAVASAGGGEQDELYAACDRAKILENKGDFVAAAQQYERALSLAPRVLPADAENLAAIQNNLAELYSKLGQYARAEPLYQRSIKIKEARLGPDHPGTALSINNLANLRRNLGQFNEAEALYKRSLAIRERAFGPNHPIVAQSLSNLAVLYQEMGNYAAAESLCSRGLKIFEANLGSDHPSVASSLDQLATLYHEQGDYAKAEPLYRRSLTIRQTALGADHLDVAAGLNNLAILCRDRGDLAQAEDLCGQSLKIRELRLGTNHPQVAASLSLLGSIASASGQALKSESFYQRSLTVFEATLGPDHPQTAECLYSLGVLYERLGDFAKAEALLRRSLKILEAKLPADHPQIARGINGLATLYQSTGQYAQAELLQKRSLELYESKFGPDHPEVASCLNNLAGLYRSLGQYAKAEPLLQRTLRIDEAKLGADHADVARDCSNLAILYQQLGQAERAAQLFERCLKIMEQRLGPDHPDVAASVNNFAALYQELGQYSKAEPLYERSLKIKQSALGDNHPDVSSSLNNLGVLYSAMGLYERAEPFYERSVKIDEAALGTDHPSVLGGLQNLALLHAATGRWSQAVADIERERRGARRHLASVLPALSEHDQIVFLEQTDRKRWHVALGVGWANRQDAAIVAQSAGWLVNGKAVAHQALAESALLACDRNDPSSAARAARLRELRGQLSTLSQAVPKAGEESAHRQRLAALSQQEQELSRQVHEAAGRGAPVDPWVEVDAIRKQIDEGALLVDIVRFQPPVFAAKGSDNHWAPARYVAWLTPPAGMGSVKIVDLGLAGPIEAAVERVRAEIAMSVGSPEAAGRIAEVGEPAAAAAIEKPLAELSSLALATILKAADGVKQLILSPDAALWLVPWVALPLGDGRYAIEEYKIRYVVSARDLVAGPKAKSATSRPVVMANPNFDLGSQAAQLATRAVLRSAPAAEATSRGPSDAKTLIGKAAPLPGTAAEAKIIAPHISEFAHAEPILYTEQYALEGVFKALRRPKVLVMSTHGFFLPDQDDRPDEHGAASDPKNVAPGDPQGFFRRPIENPLLRCGLLLAGCNRREQVVDGDDGLLTGLEIVGTDLRGVELVVLSACETGLGQVRNGEGVAGLRQAFQLAGARAVVSTLWQIPDRQTAVLIGDFFANLAAKQDSTEALREAQLAMIRRRREKFDAAHPLFWAAFTLTEAK